MLVSRSGTPHVLHYESKINIPLNVLRFVGGGAHKLLQQLTADFLYNMFK